MKWFTTSAVLFSCKTSLAAFLALSIALLLNFEKPVWAVTTVFVTSQLYAASTLSKSIFRLLGTLLGGLFILLIYPETVQSPLFFSFSVSLWVAICLYLSLKDRTPKSYIFMLAGYSAAIMGFPEVSSPYAITGTVISRLEEITLGIICSSLIHRLILPVPMHHLLSQSVSNWYKTAQKLCNDLITHTTGRRSPEREDILIGMANYPLNVETLLTHCIYEGEAARNVIRLVSVQYKHLTYLLPTLTAIETRLTLLADLKIPFPPSVAHVFQHFLLWLNFDVSRDTAVIQALLSECQTSLQEAWRAGHISTEEILLFTGLLERLANFVRIGDAWHNVTARAADLYSGSDAVLSPSSANVRHTDRGLLLLSALTAFMATFLSSLFWIGSGWADGANAPLMAAITSSFFASIDSPLVPMRLFMKGVIMALVISLFYIALLIPQANTLQALIICLFPGLFILGLMLVRPATNLIGLSVAIQLPGFIGLSHHYVPNMIVTLNAGVSTLTGIIIAVTLSALIRNKRPSWIAKRAVTLGVRDLLGFVKAVERNASSLLMRQHFIMRMLDRVNIILPRKRLDPDAELNAAGDLIAETWIGANCYDFYARYHSELQQHQIYSAQMFHELSLYLRRKMRQLATQPHPELLDELNNLLKKLEKLALTHPETFAAMVHLFNIRVSLYPHQRWF
ncbi:putative membrane protein YccC [Pantoea alhagi]|uniref:FUSC family protein n=1 Tax=Mixta sp. BE291 TaxID=3158787 RepID=UPI0028609D1B|nr:putative membrane protein YccC [Pantoea alhagi]